MKKNFGVKYTKIETKEDEDSVFFRMPYGEMKQQLTKGPDGTPVRLENQAVDFLTNVKAAHTPFWTSIQHLRISSVACGLEPLCPDILGRLEVQGNLARLRL
jgi:hypothetical protein